MAGAWMTDWGGIQRYPLEFARPHSSMNATDRWTAAYPGIEYNVRPGVIGGVYPYEYELVNEPIGMDIDPFTGEISWPNPTSDASNIQVRVTDTKGTTVTSAAWSITVATTRFKFFAPASDGGSDSNTGAINSPWLSLAKHKSTSGVSGIGIFYPGTFDMTGLVDQGEGIRWGTVTSAPSIFLAYPGMTMPVFNFNGERWDFGDGGSSPRVFIDGIDLWRGGNKTIRGFSNNDLVIRRCKFHEFGYPTGGTGSSNSAAIMWESGGHSSGFWERHVYQELEFYDQMVAAVNGANCAFKLYSTRKALLEDLIFRDNFHGAEDEEMIANKAGTAQTTVRRCVSYDSDTGIYGGNHNPAVQGGFGYCDFELCFNNLLSNSNTVVHLNYNLTQNIACYSYRNTVRGGVRIRDLSATDGPYDFYRDVIINENSGSPSGSHITRETGTAESQLIRTEVLAGFAADGYVDANGLLQGASRTSYLGLRGHEIPGIGEEGEEEPAVLMRGGGCC